MVEFLIAQAVIAECHIKELSRFGQSMNGECDQSPQPACNSINAAGLSRGRALGHQNDYRESYYMVHGYYPPYGFPC